MSSEQFGSFLLIIVYCVGPSGEFGLAVLSAPQYWGSHNLLRCYMYTTLNKKSQTAQTTFAFSS